jgi:exonuclease III
MKVATWNINGVRAHMESAVAYLRQAAPDAVCLQEIKCQTEAFPASVSFEDLGYHAAARPEGLQRRGDPLQGAARGDKSRAARR